MLEGMGWGFGGTMPIRISRRNTELEKDPEVILIWLKEEEGAEEPEKGDTVVCHYLDRGYCSEPHRLALGTK